MKLKRFILKNYISTILYPTHTHQFATGVKEKALFRPPLKGGIVLRRFIIKNKIIPETIEKLKRISNIIHLVEIAFQVNLAHFHTLARIWVNVRF